MPTQHKMFQPLMSSLMPGSFNRVESWFDAKKRERRTKEMVWCYDIIAYIISFPSPGYWVECVLAPTGVKPPYCYWIQSIRSYSNKPGKRGCIDKCVIRGKPSSFLVSQVEKRESPWEVSLWDKECRIQRRTSFQTALLHLKDFLNPEMTIWYPFSRSWVIGRSLGKEIPTNKGTVSVMV